MRIFMRAALAALAVAASVPAAAHAQAIPVGADGFASPNVTYVGSLKADVGLTTGARVIGNRLFVTSAKNISIYDITTPENPMILGTIPNVIWENEEVPTNGKILGFASDWFSFQSDCGVHPPAVGGGGCVQFWDVRNPLTPTRLYTLPNTNHTAECALDCAYFYGSAGTIVDARKILDGVTPTVIGNWKDALKAQGINEASCHHIRELRPGVLLTACRPFAVISINAEDGGTPAFPKVLFTGAAARFVHSARWPRGGTDKFIMTGGENNFTFTCDANSSTFAVYNAEKVLAGESNQFQGPVGEVEPTNGVYADGHAPAGALGCSVHWFMEHPSFEGGGLVALSEYENGVRFLQVKPDGKIVEQGYFVGLGGSSSSPKWAPDGKTVYSIDYQRGIDILRYNGDTYVPTAQGKVLHRKGRVRGTNGRVTPIALTAAQRNRSFLLAKELGALGWSPAYCFLQAQRADRRA